MTIILITSLAANLVLIILLLASLRKVKLKELEIQSIVGGRPNDRKKFNAKGESSIVGGRPDDR